MNESIDTDKIDEAVLALLHLTSFRDSQDKGICMVRAWKGHDWDALGRLHEKGLIGDTVGKSKSVIFTEEGRRKAEELFARMFVK